jgi:hypothetical protein
MLYFRISPIRRDTEVKASEARNNLKKAKAAKKRESSRKSRKIKKSQQEAYEEGLADAPGHLKRIYLDIKKASEAGKSSYNYRPNWMCGSSACISRMCEDTGNHYLRGLKEVFDRRLVKRGYEVDCKVKAHRDKVWSGSGDDMVCWGSDFKKWYLTLEVKW